MLEQQKVLSDIQKKGENQVGCVQKIDGSFIITRAQDLTPSHIDELTTKLMSKYHKLCHR